MVARLLLVVLIMTATGRALAEMPGGLTAGDQGRVVEVIDGDTVELDDGRQVRLIGLQAPKLSLGRADVRDWPLAHEARQALAELIDGREVRLHFGGERRDRHGRTLAQLERDDGLWVQGWMAEHGWARVYSFADNRTAVRELLALEAAARAAERGIWGLRAFRILAPDATADRLDSYEIVEGQVMSAELRNGRAYLNFGRDYRQDFTASIAPDDVALFVAAGIRPEALDGRRVRLRGWLYELNGPMLDLTHPEQVELLD